MSSIIFRHLVTSIFITLVATAIAVQALKSINPSSTNGIALLGVLFFLGSFVSSLVASNRGEKTSQINQPKPIKSDNSRETGTVKWFNTSKGFGFITRDNGDDVFVHFRSIRGQGHRTLIEGQRVEFNITKGEKGLQAEDVAIAS